LFIGVTWSNSCCAYIGIRKVGRGFFGTRTNADGIVEGIPSLKEVFYVFTGIIPWSGIPTFLGVSFSSIFKLKLWHLRVQIMLKAIARIQGYDRLTTSSFLCGNDHNPVCALATVQYGSVGTFKDTYARNIIWVDRG